MHQSIDIHCPIKSSTQIVTKIKQLICNFQLFTLWSWLPVRITMYQPVLLYTTEEHGCSLTTFYVRVEQHEPTLLMIKTCNNEVSPWYDTCLNITSATIEEHAYSLTTYYEPISLCDFLTFESYVTSPFHVISNGLLR